jgi:ATP synthase protein I
MPCRYGAYAKVGEPMTRNQSTFSDVWLGVGMMGLIGRSLSIPSIAGIALGVGLDWIWDTGHSCAVALSMLGLTIGFAMAWQLVSNESRALTREENRGE